MKLKDITMKLSKTEKREDGTRFMSYDEVIKTFVRNDKNRKINPKHAKKLMLEMKDHGQLSPVILNEETRHIVDGQHRTMAFLHGIEKGALPKDARLEVKFVRIPADREMDAIHSANSNTKSWTINDYIGSYIKMGMPMYVRLEEKCKKFSLCSKKNERTGAVECKYRYGAAIITGRLSTTPLKNGTFEFTEEQWKEADTIHSEMLKLIKAFGLKSDGGWIECLAATWREYRELHSMTEWLGAIKAKKNNTQMRGPKTNVKEWSQVFNYLHGEMSKRRA